MNSSLSQSSASSTSSFASVSPPTSPVKRTASLRGRSDQQLPAPKPVKRRAASSDTDASDGDEPPPGMSRTQWQKARVRRVLEAQERERRRNERPGTGSAKTVVPAATGSSALVLCKHCGKQAPPSHESRCAQKLVTCKRCRERVTARDAKRHAELCAARGKAKPEGQPQPPTASRFKPRVSSP